MTQTNPAPTSGVRPASDARLLPLIQGPADLKKLPIDQLPELAEEIRHAICDQVSKTGGHLAPNLGVVELTIALHYVFDFGHDRLLFDVGHQCYPHKLLTGRLGLLSKLRQRDGMSGFPEPRESHYDLFSVGHAGTAISTAVGMARGDTLNNQGDRKVVSLIGDASIVNGVAMEGLNNAGTLKRQFLVVLNDNGMSIAKPQGAMAQYFDRVRVNHDYGAFKKRAHDVLKRIPGGSALEELYHRAGEMMKAMITTGHMFEQFGLLCVGPLDGHDLPTLIDILTELRDFDRPVLLHLKTVKGKGFDFSTGDPSKFHSPSPFTVEGCRVEMKKSGRSFTTAYADALIDVMKRDEKVYAVTAAMPDGTGLNKVMPMFPDRSLDTGICESHAMDMCAGLAKTGIKPFFAVYSTFVQRAMDQVFQEITLQGLAVRICLDRAGFVGDDGAVHHGFMDISIFAPLPNLVMLAVSDEPNLKAGLEFMRQYDAGASVVRYPRDNVADPALFAEVPPYELGKAVFIARSGKAGDPVNGNGDGKPDLAILALGTEVYEAHKAMADLEKQGYDIALYDARFAKPVDIELIRGLIERGIPVLTVEDHSVRGGFGAIALETCNDRGIPTDLLYRHGMPERWVYQASRKAQLGEVGLDAAGIARRIRAVLDERSVVPAGRPTVAAH
ncbi:MAG: 1-deoxy-D-xylulose-5-phosphate synthase [Planctomycetes bacterium]|nr:1-deoxy-D-xylulose-5-phosphate synthase [Planctomycetota bacterium]